MDVPNLFSPMPDTDLRSEHYLSNLYNWLWVEHSKTKIYKDIMILNKMDTYIDDNSRDKVASE